MSLHDATYHSMLRDILDFGQTVTDRTGVGTKSVFGAYYEYPAAYGFPLLTTKKMFYRGIFEELLWFLKGDPDITYLQDRNVRIWDEWVKEDNTIGPGYPTQWRSWEGADGRIHDQIANVIESIKTNPFSRRHIVSAWNVGQLEDMALPPCHTMFQFYVQKASDGGPNYLDLLLFQRSMDGFLGAPFNIASYSLLMYMVAQVTGLRPGTFKHAIGDAHIYLNHLTQVEEQLGRDMYRYQSPALVLNKEVTDINDFTIDDINVVGYESMEAIKAPVAV